jgi:hypothetical protein
MASNSGCASVPLHVKKARGLPVPESAKLLDLFAHLGFFGEFLQEAAAQVRGIFRSGRQEFSAVSAYDPARFHL